MYKQQSIKSYILEENNQGVLFNTGLCNKTGAPSECQKPWLEYGEEIYSHTLLQIVTLSMCQCVSTTERLVLSN